MPAFPALENRLSDGVVELRLAKEWDIPDVLIAHQDDPTLYRRLGLVRPPSGAELGRRSEAEPGERAAGRTLCLTVVEPGDDTCRGQIDVHHLDWDQGCAELGIWLAPQFRGRGLAPQALRLAAAWLFEGCGLRRLTVRTEPDNRPMIGAARAAGFREEEPRQGSACLSLTPGDL
jgi:RimJ/RimL family protein N-acetyltransferase